MTRELAWVRRYTSLHICSDLEILAEKDSACIQQMIVEGY